MQAPIQKEIETWLATHTPPARHEQRMLYQGEGVTVSKGRWSGQKAGRVIYRDERVFTDEALAPLDVKNIVVVARIRDALGRYPDKVALVAEYRYAFGRYAMEIPGGGIEAGEDLRDAALRELREETGLQTISTAHGNMEARVLDISPVAYGDAGTGVLGCHMATVEVTADWDVTSDNLPPNSREEAEKARGLRPFIVSLDNLPALVSACGSMNVILSRNVLNVAIGVRFARNTQSPA